jgi:hypothetical protein
MPNTINPHTLISSGNISRLLRIQHRRGIDFLAPHDFCVFFSSSGIVGASVRFIRSFMVVYGRLRFMIVPAEFLFPRTGSTGPLASLDWSR